MRRAGTIVWWVLFAGTAHTADWTWWVNLDSFAAHEGETASDLGHASALQRARFNLEGDLGAGQEDCLASIADETKRWPLHNLFFGGVHTVARFPTGRLEAAADPRRGGAAVVF